MKVHYQVYPGTLGKVMFRIRDSLVARKPAEVEVTTGAADVQVLDVIGPGGLDYLKWGNEYVIIQHTWKTSWRGLDFWKPVWDKARTVVSYHDLPYDRYLRIPWGSDFSRFVMPAERKVKYGVMTTGLDRYQEAIDEVIIASNRFGWKGVHVGNVLGLRGSADRFGLITDDQMVSLYQQSAWVGGLRWTEGFELPVVEGLACGCRPICFDTPGYRHWFGSSAVYVPERRDGLIDAIVEAMKPGPVPVSPEERDGLKATFDWDVIAVKFWNEILGGAR